MDLKQSRNRNGPDPDFMAGPVWIVINHLSLAWTLTGPATQLGPARDYIDYVFCIPTTFCTMPPL